MSRAATVGGSALGIAVGWNVSNIGAVAEAVSSDYGVSLATVGVFTTALFVTHAAFQLPAGRAVDARGPRRIGLLALVILAATNGLALAAPEPGVLLGARVLMGVGTALGFVGGLDYVRSQGARRWLRASTVVSPWAQGASRSRSFLSSSRPWGGGRPSSALSCSQGRPRPSSP